MQVQFLSGAPISKARLYRAFLGFIGGLDLSNLYVLGNGFDLAHGLKTRYWDFRTFLDTNHSEFLTEFEKMYDIFPLDDTEPYYTEEAQRRWEQNVDKELWSKFEYDIGNPDIQDMLDFSQSVLEELKSEGIDYGLDDTMNYYWKNQYGFINAFPKYLSEWATEIDLSKAKPIFNRLINNNDFFLNFNYTSTLQSIYGIANDRILHIHGGIEPFCSVKPIMGHGNKKDIEYNYLKMLEYSDIDDGASSIYRAITNYLSSIYKDTDKIIMQNRVFFQKISVVEKIIVFGLSFAEVDLPYIIKIIESVSTNTLLEIYYYKDEEKQKFLSAIDELNIPNYRVNLRKTNEF